MKLSIKQMPVLRIEGFYYLEDIKKFGETFAEVYGKELTGHFVEKKNLLFFRKTCISLKW